MAPVEDFLDGLSSREAQKAVWLMQLAEDLEKIPTQYLAEKRKTHYLKQEGHQL